MLKDWIEPVVDDYQGRSTGLLKDWIEPVVDDDGHFLKYDYKPDAPNDEQGGNNNGSQPSSWQSSPAVPHDGDMVPEASKPQESPPEPTPWDSGTKTPTVAQVAAQSKPPPPSYKGERSQEESKDGGVKRKAPPASPPVNKRKSPLFLVPNLIEPVVSDITISLFASVL